MKVLPSDGLGAPSDSLGAEETLFDTCWDSMDARWSTLSGCTSKDNFTGTARKPEVFNGFRMRTSARRGLVELPSRVIGRLLMLSCSETRGADWEDSARVCEARFEDFQPKLKEPPEPQFASMQARQRVVTIVH